MLFVSDGSTDGTADIVRASSSQRVSLIELPSRSGKGSRADLGRARGDVVLFTDASIELESLAVQQLVAAGSPIPRLDACRAKTG